MTKIPILTGSYLKVDHQLVYHYTAGTGRPLLFVHGARSDALRVDSLLRYLATRFEIYAPDLPGFGKSPAFQHSFTLTTYADFIRQYIRTLDLKDFYLVGGSMGGVIAIHALKPNDLPVKKVVLFGTPYDQQVIKISPLKLLTIKALARFILASKLSLWLAQKIVASDRIMYPLINRAQPAEFRRPEIVKFEISQWRVMPMDIYLKTILETINVNFAKDSFKIKTPAIVIYSEHDHYIDNEENLKGLAQITEQLIPFKIPFKRHVPPGRLSFQDAERLAKLILNQLSLE